MLSFKLLLLPTMLLAGNSHGAEPLLQRLRANYETTAPQFIRLRTIVIGDVEQLIAVEVAASKTGRCIGSFAGFGSVNGDRLVVRAYKPESASQQCTLSIRLNTTGRTATITENNCTYYHGAECDFNGSVQAK